MKNKKLCCRIFPVVLIFISAVIAFIFEYLQEPDFQLSMLAEKNNLFNFIGMLLFISVIPISLFYFLVEKEKYQSQSRLLALLGFVPVVLILVIVLV